MTTISCGATFLSCRRYFSRFVIITLCLGLTGQRLAAQESKPAHPLDPLSKGEIALAVEVLNANGKTNRDSRFPMIALHEPPKAEVLGFNPGAAMRREAFAVVYERASNKTFEAVVDLIHKRVASWNEIPGVQPLILLEDIRILEQVVRRDPQWQQAIRKRGISDFENVQVDPWPAGDYEVSGASGARLLIAVSYYKGASGNAYAHPIEGVVAYVDLNARKVLKLVDSGVVPIPQEAADYRASAPGDLRGTTKPWPVVESQDTGYVVNGQEVRWQNWRFRFALHPLEGLVLYTVGYEDQGKLRSVLYRASLSEMVVPYGDPGPAWFFRNVFDKGEFGLGWLANALEPGTDVPGYAQLFDAVAASDKGQPYVMPRAVALYERDGGLLWKHYDYETNVSRRARDLMLSYIATVGNYDYGFNWIFHQDGSLEMEILLTGIMTTKAVDRVKDAVHGHNQTAHGHLVAKNLLAIHHQHFFNFRLDFDVDGPDNNCVVEMNAESAPAHQGNPYLNAFVMRETLLTKEKQAQRQVNPATSRKWKVINSAVRNSLGEPVGYLIVPGENSVPYALPGSSVRKRAGFMNAHLWVTAYEPTEISAAGPYVNQGRGGEGLPQWTSANRSIENRDIVLWYTLGVTHIPRPEEWPVMPTHKAGFRLAPSGFFDRNPTLAPSRSH